MLITSIALLKELPIIVHAVSHGEGPPSYTSILNLQSTIYAMYMRWEVCKLARNTPIGRRDTGDGGR